MKIERINIELLDPNVGQIDGLAANPRQWTSAEVDRIATSLKETPELFEMRPCLVYQNGDRYVVLGGNLRLEGAKKNNETDVPCIVIPKKTQTQKLKEIVIKDNGSFGKWDVEALKQEWNDLPLTDWGVEEWNDRPASNKTITETEKLSGLEYNPLYYQPEETPQLKLKDCVDLEKYNAKVNALDEYSLTDEQKETLKMFAYRFIKIDFEAVANYYAFCATDEEQKAMERLRLVLVDNGSVGGFIEDNLLRVAHSTDFLLTDGE